MVAQAEAAGARHAACVAKRAEDFAPYRQRHAEVNLRPKLTVSAVAAPVAICQAVDHEQVIAPQRLGTDHVARIAGEADCHGAVRRVREGNAVDADREFCDDAIFQTELLDAQPQQPLQSLRVFELRVGNDVMQPVQPLFAQPQVGLACAQTVLRLLALGDVAGHGKNLQDTPADGVPNRADRDLPPFRRAFGGRAVGLERGHLAVKRPRHRSLDVDACVRRP